MVGKLDPKALPKGQACDGPEQQPGDEQNGAWTRAQRERMDQRFTEAMARTIRGSSDSR